MPAEVEPPTGILWIVGTPIGNLGDMTFRALEVLRGVHAIAAEDTRRVRQLLSHFEIPHPPRMISYREENRQRAADEILALLADNRAVALVSDAGMPAVSDPGEYLVARCHQAGVRVSPVPGPSAVLAAIASSGLPSRRFTFEGFLSRRGSHRREHLESLRTEPRTMVFLEAPSRIGETLRALAETFGPERRCAIGRELTKKFEEIRVGPLADLVDWSGAGEMRGEFTLVVEGAPETHEAPAAPSEDALRAEIEALMSEGKNRRQAAREVAARYGVDSRDLYRSSSH